MLKRGPDWVDPTPGPEWLRHAAPVRCGVAELSGTYKLRGRIAVPSLRWDKIQSCYNTAPTLPVTHCIADTVNPGHSALLLCIIILWVKLVCIRNGEEPSGREPGRGSSRPLPR